MKISCASAVFALAIASAFVSCQKNNLFADMRITPGMPWSLAPPEIL